MYLFRQFCSISWLAIFFKNCTVSRASVNGDLQNGPLLPQSFSTEVAIESGLYIAPGTQLFGSDTRFLDLAPGSSGLLKTCQTWRQVRNLSDQDFRARSQNRGSGAKSPEIPKSREILEILEILGNPGNRTNLDFSRKVEISAKSWIPRSDRFPEISHVRCVYESWLRIHVHTDVRNSVRPHVHCTFERATTHWHHVHRVRVHTRTWHQSCRFVHFLTFVRFENNFWNK